MATTRKIGHSHPLHSENLLERVLVARPDAGIEDIRRLAPAFRDVPEKDLIERMARVRQRTAAKSGCRRKR